MTRSLTDVTTPEGSTLDVPEGWRQGRGAYGGLTIGASIRALSTAVGDLSRGLRSLTAELPGPTLAGPATFDVTILKAGSNLTVARSTLTQNGATTTHAVGIFASERSSDISFCDVARPEAPPFESVATVPMAAPMAPEFAANFEYRLVSGMPFARASSSTVIGYVRARNPGPARDAAYLGAMIDVWWPAIFGRMAAPRPMATIAFTLEVVGALDPVYPAGAPLLYRGTVPLASDGYFVETRELWTHDGARLLARNHQTFAIIK